MRRQSSRQLRTDNWHTAPDGPRSFRITSAVDPRCLRNVSVPPVGRLYIKRTLRWEGRYLLDTAVRMPGLEGTSTVLGAPGNLPSTDSSPTRAAIRYSCLGDFAHSAAIA
jgi:hypothetical protein